MNRQTLREFFSHFESRFDTIVLYGYDDKLCNITVKKSFFDSMNNRKQVLETYGGWKVFALTPTNDTFSLGLCICRPEIDC